MYPKKKIFLDRRRRISGSIFNFLFIYIFKGIKIKLIAENIIQIAKFMYPKKGLNGIFTRTRVEV